MRCWARVAGGALAASLGLLTAGCDSRDSPNVPDHNGAAGDTSCLQHELRFGASFLIQEYGWVCCEKRGADDGQNFLSSQQELTEPRGSLTHPQSTLFEKAYNGMTFYDVACGIPLFTLGHRQLEEWKAESNHYGWPSFRDEEVVDLYANVLIHKNHELRSSCGTFLGYNNHDRDGNRYSVNLICISGKMAPSEENTTSSEDLQESEAEAEEPDDDPP
jgi:hypothetical protein